MENLADDIFLFVQLPILPTLFMHFVQGRLGDWYLGLLFRCTPISFWLSSKMLHATNSRTVNEPSTTKYVQFQSGLHQTTDCLTPVNNSTVLLILEWHFWFFGSCSSKSTPRDCTICGNLVSGELVHNPDAYQGVSLCLIKWMFSLMELIRSSAEGGGMATLGDL